MFLLDLPFSIIYGYCLLIFRGSNYLMKFGLSIDAHPYHAKYVIAQLRVFSYQCRTFLIALVEFIRCNVSFIQILQRNKESKWILLNLLSPFLVYFCKKIMNVAYNRIMLCHRCKIMYRSVCLYTCSRWHRFYNMLSVFWILTMVIPGSGW